MRDRAVYDLAKVEVKYISTKSCSFNNFGKTNPIFSHLSNDLRFSNPRAEVTAEGTCARWTPSMGSLRTTPRCLALGFRRAFFSHIAPYIIRRSPTRER